MRTCQSYIVYMFLNSVLRLCHFGVWGWGEVGGHGNVTSLELDLAIDVALMEHEVLTHWHGARHLF